MNKTNILIIALIVLIVGIFGFIIYQSKTADEPGISSVPGGMDAFAECLSEAGAKFYGASWCSHCKNQKLAFGDSFEFVNYIECALPGGGQAEECGNADITAYPTWRFSDGSKRLGELSFEELSRKTGCEMPK